MAIFLLGAGIGGLAIALARHSSPRRIVVKKVITAPPRLPVRQPSPQPLSAPPQSQAVAPPGAASSFGALAAQLGGGSGIAVAPLGDGPIQTFGNLQVGHAWSTMKVPVVVTLLSDQEQNNDGLNATDQGYAARALEDSDNGAAGALFGQLEQSHGGLDGASSAVQQTLETAGDIETQINTAPNNQGFTTWGQSLWSNTGELLFYRALADGCLLTPPDTSYVLGLMRNVTSSQRWGAGAAGYPSGVPVAFKAGWGPENGGGYLVRQTAIVGSSNGGYVISMIARPPSGSFSDGVRMVDSIASWARAHLIIVSATQSGCSSAP